ncbi:hypothetical protein AAMO2058_000682500 [Amorphochlora amoebiformis]
MMSASLPFLSITVLARSLRTSPQEKKAVSGRKGDRNGPFNGDEIQGVLEGLQLLAEGKQMDWNSLRELIAKNAHKPHKVWPETDKASRELAKILGGPEDEIFRRIFRRVLEDGNWDTANIAAQNREAEFRPWVVLVTGVNGIRKTTSVYQPWFSKVLKLALGTQYTGSESDLPTGQNSFFRQLDYMIATIANQEFKKLYEITEVAPYAKQKAGIFSRFRTLAEMLGLLLMRSAKKRHINIMAETSGKDIAMFRYVDYIFPDDKYRKLALHFTINELSFAEHSVDSRMLREMKHGSEALASGDLRKVVAANAGGPYGSSVLKGVQEKSDKVWEEVLKGGDAGESWLKATFAITAANRKGWSINAIGPKGKPLGPGFEFGPLH